MPELVHGGSAGKRLDGRDLTLVDRICVGGRPASAPGVLGATADSSDRGATGAVMKDAPKMSATLSIFFRFGLQFAFTSIFFTLDSASSIFGSVTVRTPFLNSALALSVSTPDGSGIER